MNRQIPCFAWLEKEQTNSLFGPTILFAAEKTLSITKYLYISEFWVAVHDNGGKILRNPQADPFLDDGITPPPILLDDVTNHMICFCLST